MRTDSSVLSNLVQQASNLSDRQSDIALQLSSGTRLTTLGTDPAAAAASVRLSSQIAQGTAATTAMKTAQTRLTSADSALAAVVDRLTSAVSLAVEGSNATTGTVDRAALATQISGLSDSVMALANSALDGSYLFAGTSGSAAPFSGSGSAVTYSGDSNSTFLAASGNTLQISASGSAIFGSGSSSVFTRLNSIVQTLQSGGTPTTDQVSDLRSSLQTVIDQRSLLGTTASRLTTLTTYAGTVQANLQVEQTNLAASDSVSLATELSSVQTQRSALLSSLAILGKGSLFDYL